MGVLYDIGSYDALPASDSMISFEELLVKSSGARDFQKAFNSMFWFTYRNRFPALRGSELTSDMGWGCMIRTGQMLVSNAILKLVLSSGMNYFR